MEQLKTNKMTITKKQILAIEKAQKLIAQANYLMQINFEHLSYDVIVAQTICRIESANSTMQNTIDYLKT